METSFLAYQTSFHPSFGTQPPCEADETARLVKLYGPLFWIFRFFMRFTLGNVSSGPEQVVPSPARAVMTNRTQRRYLSRARQSGQDTQIKRRMMVSRMMSRGLTAPQYLERKARLSINGRVRTYGLRFWGSVRQRRAALSCHDNGVWQAPHTSALNGGLWDVQLPPN